MGEKTWEEKLREYVATNDKPCYPEINKKIWNLGAFRFAFLLGLIDIETLNKLMEEFVE